MRQTLTAFLHRAASGPGVAFRLAVTNAMFVFLLARELVMYPAGK